MEENQFMSADISEISEALSDFQSEVKQPELSKTVTVKTRTGGTYNFKYADLSDCKKAAAPMLKKCGLAVTQPIVGGKLITLLTHKSGQWFKSEIAIGNTADYQALGSAITYLKRYSYCAILGIVADTDDDANQACGNQAIFKDKPKKEDLKAVKDDYLKKVAVVETREEYSSLWNEGSLKYPELFVQNGDLWNAFVEKNKTIDG